MKLFIVFLLVALPTACYGRLKCYVCSGNCVRITEQDCYARSDSNWRMFCAKFKGTNEETGRTEVERSCFQNVGNKKEFGCVDFNENGVRGTECLCDSDLCNCAKTKLMSLMSLAISGSLSLVYLMSLLP